MASSCNNCSLKEKEQVYTAARDGNLMYLKVRRRATRTENATSPLPKRPAHEEFPSDLEQLFRLICLFWFDFRATRFVCEYNSTEKLSILWASARAEH